MRYKLMKSAQVNWCRADPVELSILDPTTRLCVMNCGPHRDDPRSDTERKRLCNDWLKVSKPMNRSLLAGYRNGYKYALCFKCKQEQPRKGGKYVDGAARQRFVCAVCLSVKKEAE